MSHRTNSLRGSVSLSSLGRIDSVSSSLGGAQSPTSPTALLPGGLVLFESFLQKTPPLDRLFVNWKRRWFVLSQADPLDPTSLELNYYSDRSRKGKRGSINLSKFIGIRPNAKIGNKDNVFAVETEDRQYILRAPDPVTKNIWLAKLCEFCGQEQVYHVTIPDQRALSYNEGILRFTSPAAVTVVNPSSNKVLVEISYQSIRRLGWSDMAGKACVWFETCKHPTPDQFLFFNVSKNLDTLSSLMQELKVATEAGTGTLMIMEENADNAMSFISRKHYGCDEFLLTERRQILANSMRPRPLVSSHETMLPRRVSEPAMHVNGVGSLLTPHLEDVRSVRRTNTTILPAMTRRNTLDQFRKVSSSSSQVSFDTCDGSDSGGGSDVFDLVPDSPKRRLSHQSSVSSRGSQGGSGGSQERIVPFPLNISGDLVESYEPPTVTPLAHTTPAPLVPPRSQVSLQGPYVSAVH